LWCLKSNNEQLLSNLLSLELPNIILICITQEFTSLIKRDQNRLQGLMLMIVTVIQFPNRFQVLILIHQIPHSLNPF